MLYKSALGMTGGGGRGATVTVMGRAGVVGGERVMIQKARGEIRGDGGVV